MLTKMKNIVIVLGLIVFSWSKLAYAQEVPNAKEFGDKCQQEGAVNYIDGMTREWDNPVWEAILEKFSSGDEDWIRASACVGENSGYSNATVWVSLNIAWAQALPKNPQAVLALSAFDIPLHRFCSFPIIEPEREWAAQYVKDTLAALEAIPDDATMWNIPLAIERDVCILRLKDAYAKKYDYAD